MPERQSTPGEATEQQVDTPVSPDDGAPDGAAPSGTGQSPSPGDSPSATTDPTDQAPAGSTASAPARPSPAPRPTTDAAQEGADSGRPSADDPTVASPVHSVESPASSSGSQTPAADAHDSATPSPVAPGADPGPQAGAEQLTPPEQAAGPSNAVSTGAVSTGAASTGAASTGAASTGAASTGTASTGADSAGQGGQNPAAPTATAGNPGSPAGAPVDGGQSTTAPQAQQNQAALQSAAPQNAQQQNPAPQNAQQQNPAPQNVRPPNPAQQNAGVQNAGLQKPGVAPSGPREQNPGSQNSGAPNQNPPTVVTPQPGSGAPAVGRTPAGTRPDDAPPGNGSGNGPSVGGAELFGSWDDESTRVLPRIPGAEPVTQRMRAAGPVAGAAGAGAAGVGATAAMGAAVSGPAATAPAATGPAGPGAGGTPPAASGPSGGGDGPVDQDPADGGGSGRRPRRTGLLVAAGVIGIVVLAYLGDLLFSSGSVPRGVTVAGQDIGGLSRAAAIERLQTTIEPRSGQPVQVTAGPVRSEIDPKTAGLSVDYDGTLDQAGAQPFNPITRVSSFFTTREVGVVNKADERSVRTAMEQLVPVVDRAPKDGTVRFDGLDPVPVAPEPGQHLDVEAAVVTLEQQWASGAPVALPLNIEQAATTPDDVQKAIDEVAKPAVSAPLTVTGEGANATVTPEDIAQALTFKADPDGAQKLVPIVNTESITDVVKPQLARTEKPGVDATLDFASNPPKIVPSQDGRGIDYKASFANLLPVLTGTGPRQVPAVYAVTPPDITTAKIQSLGSAGEISTFTTGGFAADSGQNIKRAAEAIDGQIVQPGETFSLDGVTNPRDASRGYVEAGIIEDGAPSRGIGGGVSQLATTLYNASYFAGMVDVEHKEHSYYISRYPVAREATVFDDLIDVKFRNDGPTAVLIKTAWTPSNVTVKFFGTKRFEVTSAAGPKTNFTNPQVVNIPPGQRCSPSKGSPGFTATDTRTMRDVQTGETTSKTRTVRYNPAPIVKCGG